MSIDSKSSKKTRSVALNAMLNMLRTLLALIGPLITYPYVSRVLGAENLGKVNYVNSIVQYFILFASLGISTYGVREGAKRRHDGIQVSQFISECFTINTVMAILSIVVLAIVVFVSSGFHAYRYLFFIEGFLIIFDLVGIEWVNTVFEDYLYITIRTIIIYIVNIIAVFSFIHADDDFYIYAIILVGTTGLVSIFNWIHCRKKCNIQLTISNNTRGHIKPILVFFANKLAVTIYVSADITMIGMFASDYRVGIYSVAVKVYTIVKNLIAAIYAVCIPRLSACIGKNDEEGYKSLYTDIVSIVSLLVLPASIGLFVLSKNIICILFGHQYLESIISLQILSIGIVFAVFGGLLSCVYNVTRNLERISLQATILAAVTNVVLNLLLIPSYQEKAAAFTTVVAEAVAFIYCLFRAKGLKQCCNIHQVAKNLLLALAGCIIVLLSSYSISILGLGNILTVAMTMGTSIVLYLMLLLIAKNEYLYNIMIVIKKKTQTSHTQNH